MKLKLAKLPDRTPAKRTIALPPELDRALQDYAELYAQTYGRKERIEDLIPYMLEAFLDSDPAFAKTRPKDRQDQGQLVPPDNRRPNAPAPKANDPHGRFLRMPEVEAMVGLRKSKIYLLMQEDTDPFPPPIHIGSRSVWIEKEVVAWKTKRVEAERPRPKNCSAPEANSSREG